jgi:GR25 family glycosyltransferase involved in LPS biosynthesis
LSVALSHLTAYQQAAWELKDGHIGDGYIMVMEDDIRLAEGFDWRLNDLVSHAPDDWEVIRVGTWGDVRETDRLWESNKFRYYRASAPFYEMSNKRFFYGGAHAVLIKTSRINMVVDQLLAQELTDIDGMLCNNPLTSSYALPMEPQTDDILHIVVVDEQSHPTTPTTTSTDVKEVTDAADNEMDSSLSPMEKTDAARGMEMERSRMSARMRATVDERMNMILPPNEDRRGRGEVGGNEMNGVAR